MRCEEAIVGPYLSVEFLPCYRLQPELFVRGKVETKVGRYFLVHPWFSLWSPAANSGLNTAAASECVQVT